MALGNWLRKIFGFEAKTPVDNDDVSPFFTPRETLPEQLGDWPVRKVDVPVTPVPTKLPVDEPLVANTTPNKSKVTKPRAPRKSTKKATK